MPWPRWARPLVLARGGLRCARLGVRLRCARPVAAALALSLRSPCRLSWRCACLRCGLWCVAEKFLWGVCNRVGRCGVFLGVWVAVGSGGDVAGRGGADFDAFYGA